MGCLEARVCCGLNGELSFWPKHGLSAWVTSSTAGVGATEFVYTKAFPTAEYGKVVAQLVCEVRITGDANSDILVTPQVSNDGVNWQDATPAFTKIEQDSTYPVNLVITIETVGQFMRFKIGLWEEKVNGDVTVIIGGNLMILGRGVIPIGIRRGNGEGEAPAEPWSRPALPEARLPPRSKKARVEVSDGRVSLLLAEGVGGI